MQYTYRSLSTFIVALILTGLIGLLAIDTAPAQAGTRTFTGNITTSDTYFPQNCGGTYGDVHAFMVSQTGTYQFTSITPGTPWLWATVHTSTNPADLYGNRIVGGHIGNPADTVGTLNVGQLYYAITSQDITGGCSTGYPINGYAMTLSGTGDIMPVYFANDAASFNGAIGSANGDGVPSVIYLTGNVTLTANSTTITSSVYLYGNNYSINGSGTARGLWVDGGGNLTAYDLTVQNGYADYGGGLTVGSGSFTGNNVTFTGNLGWDGGGSAITSWGGSVNLINSNISNNNGASAIFAIGGAFAAQGTTFTNNSCAYTITNNGGNTATNAPGCPNSAPPPAITVTSPVANAINEGASTTFTIALNATPSSQVDVQMSVNDGSQCNINGQANTTYYFNDGNTQNVTINGVADGIYDANFTCTITIQNATQTGGSGEFNGVTPSQTTFNVTVNNTDPVPSITITPPVSTTIDEGTNTTFTMALNPAPVSGLVEIIISSSDNTECRLNGQTTTPMYFDNANPSQTVTVSGQTDGIVDGNEPCTISISNAVHAGGQFDGVVPSQSSIVMTINNIDAPPPTVTITGPASTTVNEGVSASFTVNLSEPPTATVNMTIGSNNPGECLPNPSALSINAGVQTATVDIMTFTDTTVDGNQSCNITISNTSGDPRYDGITPSVTGFTMTVTDVDTPGVSVGAPVSATVAEGGNTTFDVALTANPASNVTIPLSVSDTTECSVNPTSLILGNTNPATVTINGLTDSTVDGTQACTVILGAATGPGGYNGFNPNDVAVSITNVDIANTNETGAPVPFAENGNTTAIFNLMTIPTATITATATTSTPDECSVTPASFTITDMSAQTLTISGVDDLMADGAQPCNISVSFAGAAEYTAVTYTTVANVTDINTASIAIAPNTPANIAEGGNQVYTFTLGSLPTAPMSFTVSTANTQCSVAPATVTLNNTNWNTGASVTVTGTTETITDGNQGCDLITAPATGAPEYAGMNPPDATITITDDDTAGYNVATTTPATLLEGDSGSILISLATAPDADVNFTFSTADTNICTITSATTHTFNAGNYNTAFSVNFQAPTDGITDGNQTCVVQFVAATTATGYNGLGNPAAMNFTITDIDSPNLNVSAFAPTTILEGESASYSVALTTQPNADVTLNFAPADPAVCTVSSATSHTFTATTYADAFTVTAEAVENNLVDGTRTCTIQTTIVSAATGYSTLVASDNSVDVADNDTPGIVVNLGDDGDEDVFTQVIEIFIQTQPAPGETVVISFDNLPPEIVVTPNPYVFDENNWNIPVAITIVIDENFTGDINEALTLSVGSNSPDYSSLPAFNLGDVNIVIELIPPPPPPSLNDWHGTHDENRAHAYGMPDSVYGTIHMWNGAWQYNAGGIPQELIDYGVIFAVDVWVLTEDGQPQFDLGGYQQICMLGEGRMIFMDATQSPRTMVEIEPVTFELGYTCGWIPNAGTVILINPFAPGTTGE